MLMLNALSGFGSGSGGITVVGASTNEKLNSFSCQLSVPSQTLAGDLLIACVVMTNWHEDKFPNFSGWTKRGSIASLSGYSGGAAAAVYSCISDGSLTTPTATWTDLNSYNMVQGTIAIRNASFDVLGSFSDATMSASGITVAADNSVAVGFFCASSAASGTPSISPPSGYTELVELAGVNTDNWHNLSVCYKANTGAGATGTVSASGATPVVSILAAASPA